MKPWVQFGGWAAFMVIVACVLGASARDHGLFGPNSSTIIAGVIQAAATISAIMGSLFIAQQQWKKSDEERVFEARLRDRGGTMRAFSLSHMTAARMVQQGLLFSKSVEITVDLIHETVDILGFHCAAIQRFQFEEVSPAAQRALEEAFLQASNSRRFVQEALIEVERCQNSEHRERSVRRIRERRANHLWDGAAKIRSKILDMVDQNAADWNRNS